MSTPTRCHPCHIRLIYQGAMSTPSLLLCHIIGHVIIQVRSLPSHQEKGEGEKGFHLSQEGVRRKRPLPLHKRAKSRLICLQWELEVELGSSLIRIKLWAEIVQTSLGPTYKTYLSFKLDWDTSLACLGPPKPEPDPIWLRKRNSLTS